MHNNTFVTVEHTSERELLYFSAFLSQSNISTKTFEQFLKRQQQNAVLQFERIFRRKNWPTINFAEKRFTILSTKFNEFCLKLNFLKKLVVMIKSQSYAMKIPWPCCILKNIFNRRFMFICIVIFLLFLPNGRLEKLVEFPGD